jgi:parvulin-like peptidyl-prolyl isomerase
MSLTRARRKFEAHLKVGMWVILLIFIVGIFFFYGAYRIGPGREAQSSGGAPAVLATVDGKPVTRDMFDRMYVRYSRMSPFGQSIQSIEVIRSMVLEEAIGSILLAQAAKDLGVSVSNAQVDQYINSRVEATMTEKKQRNRPTTPEIRKAVEESFRNQAEDIRSQLLQQAVYDKVTSAVRVTDKDLLASFDEVKARHILVAFQPAGKKKRTDEEARKKAEDLLKQLKAGADFATLAKKESDDTMSAQKGGDLGWFKPGQMVKPFEDAAFSAKIGEIVGPVKTDFGYHLIQVEARRSSVPKDLEQRKKDYSAGLLQQRKQAIWREFITKLRDSAKVKVTDPEMLAARAMQQDKVGEAIALYRKTAAYAAALGPEVQSAVQWTLGNLLSREKKWQEAADAYQAALSGATGSRGELYASLAEMYSRLKQAKDALDYAKGAVDEAPQDLGISRRVQAVYKELGQKDLAEAEKKRSDELEKQLKNQGVAGGLAPAGQ